MFYHSAPVKKCVLQRKNNMLVAEEYLQKRIKGEDLNNKCNIEGIEFE